MARRRASRRGHSNVLRNQVWIVDVLDAVNVDDTPVVEEVLLTGSDWTQLDGTERGLLVTIRGWLRAYAIGQETIRAALGCLIYVTDTDAPVLAVGSNGPWDPSAYLEDILWTGGGLSGGAQATTLEAPRPFTIGETSIHVKAMRRIKTDQQVRIAMVMNTAGNAVSVNGVLRTLVRRSG